MRGSRLTSVLAAVVLAVFAAPLPAQNADAAPEWKDLFNGRTLDGWTATESGVFRVEDGCIVGTVVDGKGGDLFFDREFEHFELRFVYKIKWSFNAGVWYRTGYQFDILRHSNRPRAVSGSLWYQGSPKPFGFTVEDESLEHPGGWNLAQVYCCGDRIIHFLNGKMVGQTTASRYDKGKIGLQVHGGADYAKGAFYVMKVQVRPLGKDDPPSQAERLPASVIRPSGRSGALSIRPWGRDKLDALPTCVSPGPQRNTVAVALSTGAVEVWDLAKARRLNTLVDQEDGVTAAAVSSDARWLATVSAGNHRTFRLYDLATMKVVKSMPVRPEGTGYSATFHRDTPSQCGLAFAPDSKSLAIGSESLVVLSLPGLQSRVVPPLRQAPRHTDRGPGPGMTPWQNKTTPHGIAFSPDGKLLAVSEGHWTNRGQNGDLLTWLRLLDAKTLQPVGKQPILTGTLSVEFSHDSRLLAAGGGFNAARILDLATGKITTLEGASDGNEIVGFAADSQSVVLTAGNRYSLTGTKLSQMNAMGHRYKWCTLMEGHVLIGAAQTLDHWWLVRPAQGDRPADPLPQPTEPGTPKGLGPFPTPRVRG